MSSSSDDDEDFMIWILLKQTRKRRGGYWVHLYSGDCPKKVNYEITKQLIKEDEKFRA